MSFEKLTFVCFIIIFVSSIEPKEPSCDELRAECPAVNCNDEVSRFSCEIMSEISRRRRSTKPTCEQLLKRCPELAPNCDDWLHRLNCELMFDFIE